jgi:chromosome segregation ATPase
MMHAATNSTLEQQLSNHLARIGGLSNRLPKASESLKQTQEEQASTRTQLDQQTKRASDSELLAEELENEVRSVRNMLQGREVEIGKLMARIKEADTDIAAYRARLQKAEADIVRLQLDQTDEAALRAQLKRLDRQWPPVGFARPPKHSATAEAKGAKSLLVKVDTQAKGYYLQIQPDATVKLLPPLEAAGASAR